MWEQGYENDQSYHCLRGDYVTMGISIGDLTGKTRREYISRRQGYAPSGWICVGVCGYHEKTKKSKEN